MFHLQEEHGDYTYVERVHVPLDQGSLLLMEGATQEDWQVSTTAGKLQQLLECM